MIMKLGQVQMLQDFNNKFNRDKNLKLMMLSAIALVTLFLYTIYKSSDHIQSSNYSVGLVFLVFLALAAFVARRYRKSLKKYIDKKNKDSVFQQELNNSMANEGSVENENRTDSVDYIKSNTSFDDVAGIASVKEELEEVVDFLNKPKKYQKYGVNLPKGVILYGPPGVGKTLIAKAVAGEASVPFFYQSGANFVQIYVGMGAKRVRELFNKAKANAPAIIFIDEIDAIGKKRGGSSNDEREATLNELLTQMDGFEDDNGVIVIAATNKIDSLDEALLRAGRFDRRVELRLPNINDRKELLSLYLKKLKHNLDVEKLASSLAGFSSASIATLINEAMLYMIKVNEKTLDEKHISFAKQKLEFGMKENFVLSDEEKEILSIYQASKAYISKEKTSLFEENSSKINSVFPSRKELKNLLKIYLAGSIGLEVIKDEQYAIFENDLKLANDLAKEMVEKYAMAEDEKLLITQIKAELKKEFDENYEKISSLAKIMYENEVIKANEL